LSAAKRACPEALVEKRGYFLGSRNNAMQTAKLTTTPDISIRPIADGDPFIADAKYKTVATSPAEGQPRVVATGDIYEALAFMRAARVKHCIFLYPGIHRLEDAADGGQPIEIIEVDDVTITACSIAVAGISKPRGFGQFCKNLRQVLDVALTSFGRAETT
jgi:5-methylcytosine-specific restriction endonuclease McrBC regulatory subunit McrC